MSNNTQGVHILSNTKGNGWTVQSSGAVLSTHRSKDNAVAEGRRVAKRHAAQLTIHRPDGEVVETRTYAIKPLQ